MATTCLCEWCGGLRVYEPAPCCTCGGPITKEREEPLPAFGVYLSSIMPNTFSMTGSIYYPPGHPGTYSEWDID